MSEVELRGLPLMVLLSRLTREAKAVGLEKTQWLINQFYPAITARSLYWAVAVFYRVENN